MIGSRVWKSVVLLLALMSHVPRVHGEEVPAQKHVWLGGGVLTGRTLTSGSGHANLSTLRLEGGWRHSANTEFGFEVSPFTNIRQTDTYRGNHFENVSAVSAALLARRHFDLPLRPFFEASAGIIKSAKDIPRDTTDLNFLLNGGVGIVLVERRDWSLIGTYRLTHISNGGREESNPGYNMQSLGMSVRFDFVKP